MKKKHLWISYWQERFKRLDKGESGLSIVCRLGKPDWYNRFFQYQKKVALKRNLNFCGGVRGKKVLDVGCGIGTFSQFFYEKGAEVVGTDINAQVLRRNRRAMPFIHFLKMPAQKMSLKDNCFDFVVSFTVLGHIHYDEQDVAVSELCRVTKPGEYIFVIESTYLKDTSPHTFPLAPDEWISIFHRHGCKLLRWEGEEYAPLTRILPRIRAFYSSLRKKEGEDAKSKESNEENGKMPLGEKIYALLERIAIYLSYPAEPLSRALFPSSFARQGAFLYQKL